ncbi:MAG: hypothetical protein GX207_05075 [Peptococcaceae bacterium]|jgi:hypothetical protein|nr:hypothetical protein [Peptococcaceae bacterium]
MISAYPVSREGNELRRVALDIILGDEKRLSAGASIVMLVQTLRGG